MIEHGLNLDDFELDEIESIELIGEEDTIDITVDGTHMFFANDIYTHNSSIKSSIVEADQMGGSIKKGQIGHFIVSIAKSLSQKEEGKATMAILKSRFGKDGIVFEDVTFDNSRIQIDMGENNTGLTNSEYKKEIQMNDQERVNEVLASSLRRRAINEE
jgi:hypothetical protein